MILNIFTDGGSLNNPGQAAYAFVVFFEDGLPDKHSGKIGIKTNNFAEYTALVEALKYVKKNHLKHAGFGKITKIVVRSDSKLMVNQINGLYKVKNPDIKKFILMIRILEQEVKIPLVYKYIPREENSLADSLVKKELRRPSYAV